MATSTTRTLLVVAVVGVLGGGCASHARSGTPGRPTPSTSTTTASPTPPSTVRRVPPSSAPGAAAPPAVAPKSTTVHLTVVDSTRPTVSRGTSVADARTLDTTVWLPADDDGHPIGRHLPWLVFLHGFDVEPDTYARMIEQWARAGYAVAAPLLPLTSSQSGSVQDEADMVNEPADVSFLITSLLARSAAETGPLSDRLDPRRIGVAGHSDGANVAFATGYSSTLGDPRIVAVIDESGELPTGMGPYPPRASGPPLLLIASDRDEFVRAGQTRALFDAVDVPRWWLMLHGAAHLPPFGETNAWSAVVDQVTVDFLHVALGGFDVDPATIAVDAHHLPTATLEASSPD